MFRMIRSTLTYLLTYLQVQAQNMEPIDHLHKSRESILVLRSVFMADIILAYMETWKRAEKMYHIWTCV